jgi:hypothetical protein
MACADERSSGAPFRARIAAPAFWFHQPGDHVVHLIDWAVSFPGFWRRPQKLLPDVCAGRPAIGLFRNVGCGRAEVLAGALDKARNFFTSSIVRLRHSFGFKLPNVRLPIRTRTMRCTGSPMRAPTSRIWRLRLHAESLAARFRGQPCSQWRHLRRCGPKTIFQHDTPPPDCQLFFIRAYRRQYPVFFLMPISVDGSTGLPSHRHLSAESNPHCHSPGDQQQRDAQAQAPNHALLCDHHSDRHPTRHCAACASAM